MPERTIKRRELPVITKVGKREFLSTGRWNDLAIADYIMGNGTETLEIADLARIAYGHSDQATRTKVRRYLHKIKQLLIDRGVLMVVDYEAPRRRAIAVKIYDGNSSADRQYLEFDLRRMRQRGEISLERYDRAIALLTK